MKLSQVAKNYGITETAAKQFLAYGIKRAKYGQGAAATAINKPQLNALVKAGIVTNGGCGCVGEVTDLGMQLFVDLKETI